MLAALTVVHVLISLIGIATGLHVAFGLASGNRMDRWTTWFLWTTVATSVTGFFFPIHGITPGMVLGVLSLIALAVASYARYSRAMEGGWRTAYVMGAVMALYFNVFVLVVQSFRKIPWLTALAPTQTEPPFAITQGVVLVAFVALGIAAVRGFRAPGQPLARAAAAR